MKINNIVTLLLCIGMIYLLFFKEEKMTADTNTKKLIQDHYKIDVDAIRNLSKLANDLTKDGKLRVPGGLEVDGGISWHKGKGRLVAHPGDGANIELDNMQGKRGIHMFANYGNNGARFLIHDKQGTRNIDFFNKDMYINGTSTFNGPTNFKNQKTGKMSHLNHPNGNIYLRGNVNIDGHGNSGKDLHVHGVTHLKNELVIHNGNNKGATHFNHQNKGENYIRGNLRLDGHAGHHDYNGASGQGMHLIDLKVDGDRTVLIKNASGQAYHKNAWVCMMVGYWENFGGPHGGNDEWKYCFIGNKDHWHFKSHRTSWNNGHYTILCIPRTLFNRVDHNAREYR